MQVSRIGQWKSWSAWIVKLGLTDTSLDTSNNKCQNVSAEEGSGSWIGVEEYVKKGSKSLHGYLRNSTEWMLQIVLMKEKILVEE